MTMEDLKLDMAELEYRQACIAKDCNDEFKKISDAIKQSNNEMKHQSDIAYRNICKMSDLLDGMAKWTDGNFKKSSKYFKAISAMSLVAIAISIFAVSMTIWQQRQVLRLTR